MKYLWFLIILMNVSAIQGQVDLTIVDECRGGKEVLVGVRVGDKIFSKDTLSIGINKISLLPGMYALVRSGILLGDIVVVQEDELRLVLNCDSIKMIQSPVNSAFFSFVNAPDSTKRTIYEQATGAAKDVLQWCYPQLSIEKLSDLQRTNAGLNSLFTGYLVESKSFMFNSPFFELNMEHYLNNWISQDADTLIKYMKVVESKLQGDDKAYFLRFVLHRFESSKILGQENVFIDLALRNVGNREVLFDSTTDFNILNKAKQLYPNRIGERVSDFVMRVPGSSNFENYLASPGLYKLLFFFDPDCHHCKEAFPSVLEFARKHVDAGVHVYAVATSLDLPEYQRFIVEQPKLNNVHYRWDPVLNSKTFRDYYYIPSTPTIYLTTATGICLARGIAAAELDSLFGHIINN